MTKNVGAKKIIWLLTLMMVLVLTARLAEAAESVDYKALMAAAEEGNAEAQYRVGLCYALGQGVPQNDREAIPWYQKAAGQGHAGAQSSLGLMYAEGRGVAQDDKQAVTWYRKAAEQGHAKAQYNLAFMYGSGRGVPQDDVNAYAWYSVAADQGQVNAAKGRDQTASQLTPVQRAQAKAVAAEFHTKILHR